MRSRHIIKRGNHFHYVCRVPQDPSHFFPCSTIWKSLKNGRHKNALLVAAAEEYRAQQLFLQLKTGMLDPNLEKQLRTQYLKKEVECLEAKALGRKGEQGKQRLTKKDS